MNHTHPPRQHRLIGRAAIAALISLTAMVPTGNPPFAATTSAAEPLERAKTAAQAFSGQLRGTLQAAMQGEGPEAAVEVCHAGAPAIASEVMRQHGLRLGRVALPGRHRNPEQAAQDWQLDILRQFQLAVENGAPATGQVWVQKEGLPKGVALRMMRGIATEQVCTSCHGTDIAPGVRAIIARHYPGDGATGFGIGDLRGALWVEVPDTGKEVD